MTQEQEVHLIKCMLTNRKTKDLSTGETTVFDDDGTTPVLILTPSESDGVLTITPSLPD